MSSPLHWGIIGTGAIATTFARGLAAAKTGQLVAVGSRGAESAGKFGDEFGIAPSHRHARYEALLADPDVQAVYISTPHPFHAEWAIKAAEAGKHILCEKPFTLNHAEAMAVMEAAWTHRVFVMEAFMYRCHPQTAKLVELLRNQVIGEVRVIQATFSFHAGFNPEGRLFSNALAGGGILDVGCYTVSMARLLAGAALGQPFADPIEVKGMAHLGTTGVDEWATGILRFEGDILAQVATGIALNQENVVRVFGSDGRIVVPNPWLANRGAADLGKIILHRQGEKEPQEVVAGTEVTSFTLEADAVGRAVAAGQLETEPPAMTRADTLGNMQTLDRWREAVGLTYEAEKPANDTFTVTRRPLRAPAPPAIPRAMIPGLTKPVSRLVMGVDNQRTMPHAAVMFDDFFERGGTCWDCAWIYGGGLQERLLGQWVKNRGIREQVVLLDKGAHTPFCDPVGLTRQLLESLDRLQTDYVDVYMMHRDNPAVPVGEFIDVLNEHVRAGRIRVFGGSNWSLDRVQAANDYAKAKGLQGFTAISNNFSLARMVKPVWPGSIAASDAESRAWLEKTQMPLFPWSSQARGFFTSRADLPAESQPDKSLVNCWYSDDNVRRRERAYQLARERGVEPIAIALAYVLCQPFPTFPLIGPRTLEETRTSLPGLGVQLSPAELKWLNLESDSR